MVDTLPDLPPMSEAALEDWLLTRGSGEEGGGGSEGDVSGVNFSPQSAQTLRVRRRRDSFGSKRDEEQDDAVTRQIEQLHLMVPSTASDNTAPAGGRRPLMTARHVEVDDLAQTPFLKFVILGDDILTKIQSVRSTFAAAAVGTPAGSGGGSKGSAKDRGGSTKGSTTKQQSTGTSSLQDTYTATDLTIKRLRVAGDSTATGPTSGGAGAAWSSCFVQPWVPPVDHADRHLRQEMYEGVDCFVVFYSVKNRDSFERVATHWIPEVQAYLDREKAHQNLLAGVPIVLVGGDAEVRNSPVGQHQVAVQSAEAVQLAQEVRASKYMEVFADNPFHAEEVYSQAAAVAFKAREQEMVGNDGGAPFSRFQRRFLEASCVLGPVLRVSQPKGVFDLVQKTFTLTADDGSEVGAGGGSMDDERPTFFITIDGSCPVSSPSALPYKGVPIVFDQNPLPKKIRVVGRARCHYPSMETEFAVPKETPIPRAYFDVCNKTFVVDMQALLAANGGNLNRSTSLTAGAGFLYKNPQPHQQQQSAATASTGSAGGIQVRYTLDGTEPNARSAIYRDSIAFDPVSGSMLPWTEHVADPPKVIKLIAIGEGQFRSKVVSVEAPPVLDQPRVSYNHFDGLLRIEASSHVECRYTLDGTTPTLASTLYACPVMVPKEQFELKRIRVAAFPKQYFPSREVVVDIGAPVKRDPNPITINTTKSFVNRMETTNAQMKRNKAPPSEQSMSESGGGGRNTPTRSRGSPATAAVDSRRVNSPSRRGGGPGAATSGGGGTPNRSGRWSPQRQQQAGAGGGAAKRPPWGSGSGGTGSPLRTKASTAAGIGGSGDLHRAGSGRTLAARGTAAPMANTAMPTDGGGADYSSRYRDPAATAGATAPYQHQPLHHCERELPMSPPRPPQQALSTGREEEEFPSVTAGTTGGSNGAGMSTSTGSSSVPPRPAGPTRDDHNNRRQEPPPPQDDNNTIDFDFETPIALSHITVATPGHGQGPSGYEVKASRVLDGADNSGGARTEVLSVGSGQLDDFEGVQTLHVFPSARLMPVNKVSCTFTTHAEGDPFHIVDMKIHGKPFR